jgi:hypothetical protein
MSEPVIDAVQYALNEPPPTPAGRQAAWFLSRLHAQGKGATLADFERYSPMLAGGPPQADSDAQAIERWRELAARVGAIETIALAPICDLEAEATIVAKGRRWKFAIAVEAAAPHRIEKIAWERLFDFKLEVREATPADAAILADLESRCPIVHDDVSVWFDRGEHYFDFSRLMEDCTVGLATVDGTPAAVTCGARHTVRIGGALRSIISVSHLRVLPEHQRKGLWGAANRVLDKYWPTVDGSSAYIAVGNAGMQHGFRSTPNKWPICLQWAKLDCARLAGPAFGKSAVPADAALIVQGLNAFHQREEMFVPYMPIRLSPMTTTFRMLPIPRIQGGIGGRFVAASNPEQAAEAVERVVAAVEAEGELVEVGLQVLGADAVVRALEPRLQVREHHVDHRQIVLGDLRVIVLGGGKVFEATLLKAGVAVPAIGHDHRSRRHSVLNEAAERRGGAVGHDRQADAPGDPAALALVQVGRRVALADLDGAGDEGLIVDAPAFAARLAADPALIDLDVILNPADPIRVRADHSGPQLVEDLEGRLVAGEPKLALELNRAHARRLAADEVGCPEPHAQRRVRALHDRSSRQASVFAALSATEDAGASLETEGLASGRAMRTDEAVAPPSLFQVGRARRVIGEQLLELGERTGERKVTHRRALPNRPRGCIGRQSTRGGRTPDGTPRAGSLGLRGSQQSAAQVDQPAFPGRVS